MQCMPPTNAKVVDFSLHCATKTLTLETKLPNGKYNTFKVDLTPMFVGCDGEDLFPMKDTRYDNPNVGEVKDGFVTLSFDIIDVLTGNVIDVEMVDIPVGGSTTPPPVGGLPPGGITGEPLTKASAADGDVQWGRAILDASYF